MTITPSEFEAFKAHVTEPSGFRERECHSYLHYAAKFLVPETSTQIISIPEDPNYFGETDFVIATTCEMALAGSPGTPMFGSLRRRNVTFLRKTLNIGADRRGLSSRGKTNYFTIFTKPPETIDFENAWGSLMGITSMSEDW